MSDNIKQIAENNNIITLIRSILEDTRGLSAWKINGKKVEASELFFIRQELDMSRAKDVEHYQVTVYKDFEEDGMKFRGSSTTSIHPTMSGEEIAAAVGDALFAAGFARNEFYPLARPVDSQAELPESSLSGTPLGEWTARMTEAIYQPDNQEKGRINSAELFLNREENRILNSDGVDVFYVGYRAELEIITNWQEEGEEVELYDDFQFAGYDPERISAEIEKMLHLSREKAVAGPTPELESHTVLLTGDPVKEFIQYYYQQANAENVYQQVSTARLNESLQGKEIRGDSIKLELDPGLENSVDSVPYDRDGYPLKPVTIMEEGVLKRYWGDVRHSYYLGVEPTGNIRNIVISGGDRGIEELKSEPYLELLYFSDFQMDPLTGNFGGEIRLGRYYDGDRVVPVTGGSISGNIKDVQQELYLSNELQIKNNFVGPAAVKLYNVSVTGS